MFKGVIAFRLRSLIIAASFDGVERHVAFNVDAAPRYCEIVDKDVANLAKESSTFICVFCAIFAINDLK